jgi:hypothetical protein
MLLTKQYCYICKEETNFFDGDCSVCLSKKEKEHKEKYFAELEGLSVEQRVDRIEQWIYNHMNENNQFPFC